MIFLTILAMLGGKFVGLLAMRNCFGISVPIYNIIQNNIMHRRASLLNTKTKEIKMDY